MNNTANPTNPPNAPPTEGRLARALRFVSGARFRDMVFVLGLLAVEALLAYRYGYDTYMLARQEGASIEIALADAALIDGVFVLLVTVAHFAGRSKKANKMRPLALVGAAIMYFGVMLPIGSTMGQVALAARIAGAMMLAFVGSDVAIDVYHAIAGWLAKRKQARANEARPDFRARLRQANANIAYIVGMWVWLLPSWFMLGVVTVARDYLGDLGLRVIPAASDPPDIRVLPATDQRRLGPASQGVDTQLQASIYRTQAGRYAWACPACGLTSEQQPRGKADYASERGAQRGFAGHAGKHASEVLASAVLVDEDS